MVRAMGQILGPLLLSFTFAPTFHSVRHNSVITKGNKLNLAKFLEIGSQANCVNQIPPSFVSHNSPIYISTAAQERIYPQNDLEM